MTKKRLRRYVGQIVFAVVIVLLLAAMAKCPKIPIPESLYGYITDMSILIFTIASVLLANTFRKRQVFIDSLREEWREIVDTKAALSVYCQREAPSLDDYLDTYCLISRAIDNMRMVYRNVGETKKLIGYYPFEPLHDMRRSMEAIDPRNGPVSLEERMSAREDIWEAFNALRERFLDELELVEPANPILGIAAKRTKQPGSSSRSQAS
tara:strand:- start:2960 stop:3586 length:627 start_codon:yes stop_codon:yes gene_type:complete